MIKKYLAKAGTFYLLAGGLHFIISLLSVSLVSAIVSAFSTTYVHEPFVSYGIFMALTFIFVPLTAIWSLIVAAFPTRKILFLGIPLTILLQLTIILYLFYFSTVPLFSNFNAFIVSILSYSPILILVLFVVQKIFKSQPTEET